MRRLLAGALLAALVCSLTSPAFGEKRGVKIDGQSPKDYYSAQLGRSWAVVIGIDDYQNPDVQDLKYAVADARAVARALERRGYQVVTIYNKQATRRNIESELRSKLPNKVGPNDRVLVFYAGHGQDQRVPGGKTMGYLLPADSDRNDVPATGISMGTVQELADALPAKHALFLLDVCFGGIAGVVKRGQPPAVTEAYLRQITRERGRHLITAGEADQEVIEAPQWGHSVFTYFLLKGLDEGLADQDHNGIITVHELYSYMEPRVFSEAQLRGHTQKPQMAELSGEKGQFVFFTTAAGTSKVAAMSSSDSETELAQERERQAEAAAQLQAEREKFEAEQKAFAEEQAKREAEERRLKAEREAFEKERQLAEERFRLEAERHRLEDERKRFEVARAPAYEAPARKLDLNEQWRGTWTFSGPAQGQEQCGVNPPAFGQGTGHFTITSVDSNGNVEGQFYWNGTLIQNRWAGRVTENSLVLSQQNGSGPGRFEIVKQGGSYSAVYSRGFQYERSTLFNSTCKGFERYNGSVQHSP